MYHNSITRSCQEYKNNNIIHYQIDQNLVLNSGCQKLAQPVVVCRAARDQLEMENVWLLAKSLLGMSFSPFLHMQHPLQDKSNQNDENTVQYCVCCKTKGNHNTCLFGKDLICLSYG